MKSLFLFFIQLLHWLGGQSVIVVKFLVFFFISPITAYRCIGHAWNHKSFRAAWSKFTWIWDAYWGKINL